MQTELEGIVEGMGIVARLVGFENLPAFDMVELSTLILDDTALMERLTEFYELEMRGPKPHAVPDEILRSLLETMPHGEKAALRNRAIDRRNRERLQEQHDEAKRRAFFRRKP